MVSVIRLRTIFFICSLIMLTSCRNLEQYWAAYSVRIRPQKDLLKCVVYLDDGFLVGPMFVGKGYGKTYSMIERKRPKLIRVSWEEKDGGKHYLNVDMKGKFPDAWKVGGDTIVVIVNEDNTYDLQFVVFEGEWNTLKIKRLPPKGEPTKDE